MADAGDRPKAERFDEFLHRLAEAPAVADFDDTFRLLGETLNAVEDEMTSIPFDSSKWMSDGRMYSPQRDSLRAVPGRPDVRRFRSKAHNTLIGDNGAIEVRGLDGRAIFSKPGADGRGIGREGHAMNRMEAMRGELVRRFPGTEFDLDAPADPRGPWFLTVPRAGLAPIVVEWRPERGFWISTPSAEELGSGPEEVHRNAEAALARVGGLLESGGAAGGTGPVRLSELRQLRGVSQAELAERAGVRQANVSRIERRGDLLLTTLGRIVGGMGGRLTVRATFPDGTEREIAVGGHTHSDIPEAGN